MQQNHFEQNNDNNNEDGTHPNGCRCEICGTGLNIASTPSSSPDTPEEDDVLVEVGKN
jgi:hypothetical protein